MRYASTVAVVLFVLALALVAVEYAIAGDWLCAGRRGARHAHDGSRAGRMLIAYAVLARRLRAEPGADDLHDRHLAADRRGQFRPGADRRAPDAGQLRRRAGTAGNLAQFFLNSVLVAALTVTLTLVCVTALCLRASRA